MADFSTYRFPLSDLTLKPGKVSGQRALALVYADTRAYQDALDAAQVDWQTHITPVSLTAVVVQLTINGVTRSATGEDTDLMSAEARAFKRACSAFGLGRYLYSVDLGWQPFDGRQFAPAAYEALARAVGAKRTQQDEQPQATHRNGVLVEDDGDILFATPSKPSKPKAEPPVWQTWQDVDDLITWALDNGYALAPKHARNALRKVVDTDLGGRLTKANWRAACEAFYHNRIQRQAEKAAA